MGGAIKKFVKKSAPTVLTGGLLGGEAASAGLAGAGTKKVMDKLTEVPEAPALAPVAVMPTADDDAIRAAKRRRLLANTARSGRQSTMLSTTDTLG
jgi:hypothetical protein